jgi:ribosomal protein S27AE
VADNPDGVDLGFRCPACGGEVWVATDAHNRWRCSACDHISKIENGVMVLMPEDRAATGLDDEMITVWLGHRPERSWDAVNRDFCNWVHRRIPAGDAGEAQRELVVEPH